jgi:hypothetical protein
MFLRPYMTKLSERFHLKRRKFLPRVVYLQEFFMPRIFAISSLSFLRQLLKCARTQSDFPPVSIVAIIDHRYLFAG